MVSSGGSVGELSAALRALGRRKLHMVPGTLSQMGSAVGKQFASPWAPAEALKGQLQCFPTGLLHFWASQERGHVLIGPRDGGYLPGPQQCSRRQLDGVAHVSVADLTGSNPRPLVLVAHLLDHLLGCRGFPGGQWLSDGGGVTCGLQDVGQQIVELHALGYAQSQVALSDPHAYFAEGLVGYCRDRQALNVADPRLERLLRRTLFSDEFWLTAGA